MTPTHKLNELLHDADRAQGGADFAAQIGHSGTAAELRAKAIGLYREALSDQGAVPVESILEVRGVPA
jgi:hypothetical protein